MPSFHDALQVTVQLLIGVPLTLVFLFCVIQTSDLIFALWDGKKSFGRWPRKTLSKWTSIWMRFLFPFIVGSVGCFIQIDIERHKDRSLEANHPILLWLFTLMGVLLFVSHLVAMLRRTKSQFWKTLGFVLLWFGMGLLGVFVTGITIVLLIH